VNVARALRKARIGIGRLGWWFVASLFPSVTVGLAACAYGPQVAYGPPPTCQTDRDCVAQYGSDWYCDRSGGAGDPDAGDADNTSGDPDRSGFCRQRP
jgi:hypothetical protein